MLPLGNEEDPLLTQSGTNVLFCLNASHGAPSSQSLNIFEMAVVRRKTHTHTHNVPVLHELTEQMDRKQSIVLGTWRHN